MGDLFISDISLDGFQVVNGQFFSKIIEPTLSIRKSCIAFNAQARAALNHCETVKFLINSESKRMLVQPISSSEQDAVRWAKFPDKMVTQTIECTGFVKRLYEIWNLNPSYTYRVAGKIVSCDRKLMLMFDCANAVACPVRSGRNKNV